MKAKRFLSMVLSGCLMVLTLFSFAGCGESGANEELKKQIAALTEQVETLEAALKEKQDKEESELKKQIAELNQKVETLEAALKAVQDKLVEGEDCTGMIVTLSDAYSLQWLNREDLMNISYYRHGTVWVYQNGEKNEIDFQPTIEKPEISEWLEMQCKHVIYEENQEIQSHLDGINDIIITGYFGCYNGNYVVEYRFQGIDEGAEVKPDIIIEDIPFLSRNAHFLRVIQFNE